MSHFRRANCYVCNRDRDVCVASSPLGAMSHTYCTECLVFGAEPTHMVLGLLWMVNGDLDRLHESIRDTLVYHNGEYRIVDDWIKEIDIAAICKQMDDDYERIHNEGYVDIVIDASEFADVANADDISF